MSSAVVEENIIEKLKKGKFMTSDEFDKIPPDKYNDILLEYKRILYLGKIETVYGNNIVTMPQLWKEFIMVYWLALDIIKKHYENNSLILSLGESPCKLVFTQSLFYNNAIKASISEYKNMPENIEFQYVPLSDIRHFNVGSPLEKAKTVLTVTGEQIYNSMSISPTALTKYEIHFNNHGIDPISIINNIKDKFITVDRVESYKSICSYIFVYFSIAKNNLTEGLITIKQINILINKFKIVGFEGYYNKTAAIAICNKNTIEFISILLQTKFSINKIDADAFSKNMFFLYEIHYQNIPIEKKPDKLKKMPDTYIYSLFQKYFYTDSFYNYINFITLPEFIKRDSRCIKSLKILDTTEKLQSYGKDNILYESVSRYESLSNCNIINLVYYIVLKKLIQSDIINKIFDDKLDLPLIHYNYNEVLDGIISKITAKPHYQSLFKIMKNDSLLNKYSIFNIGFVPSYNQITGSEPIPSSILFDILSDDESSDGSSSDESSDLSDAILDDEKRAVSSEKKPIIPSDAMLDDEKHAVSSEEKPIIPSDAMLDDEKPISRRTRSFAKSPEKKPISSRTRSFASLSKKTDEILDTRSSKRSRESSNKRNKYLKYKNKYLKLKILHQMIFY